MGLKSSIIICVVRLIILIGVAGFLFFSAAFFFKNPPSSEKENKVAATIFPLYDLVRNIAGQELEVVLVLKPGASPHTFEPTPKETRELFKSAALFAIGHGLDNWSFALADSAEAEKVIIVDKNVKLLSSNGDDPHYFLSIPNSILMAEQIQEELTLLYPDKASPFEQNFKNYRARLGKLNEEIEEKLRNLPNRKIATFHNAWGYFSKDYALEVVATFEEFPGEEPTAEYLANFQEAIRRNGITVIFTEPQFSPKPLEAIAKDLKVTFSVLDPLGGESGRKTYEDLLRYNVKQILESQP